MDEVNLLRWCPSILVTLLTHLLGLATPYWSAIIWESRGVVQTHYTGLFINYNEENIFLVCTGSGNNCEEYNPDTSSSWHFNIVRTLFTVGGVFLVFALVLTIPTCTKILGGDVAVLSRLLKCSGFLIVSGSLWLYANFQHEAANYARFKSFVSMNLGYSFYISTFSGCLAIVHIIVINKISKEIEKTTQMQSNINTSEYKTEVLR